MDMKRDISIITKFDFKFRPTQNCIAFRLLRHKTTLSKQQSAHPNLPHNILMIVIIIITISPVYNR